MSWIRHVRGWLHGSDVARARATEREVLAGEATRAHAFHERLDLAYGGIETKLPPLATSVERGRAVRLSRPRLLSHWSIMGPSGVGKSYFLALLLQSLVRSGVYRFFLADPKLETIELAERVLIGVGRTLSGEEREELLGRVVVIDPFSAASLPCLQILDPAPGVDPELQAFEVASLITTEINLGGMGVRQEGLLHRAIECLIHAKLPLTVLPRALREPRLFERLAERGFAPDLSRATAARFAAESAERVAGIVSRVEALLRLRATRLALGGATRCMSFGQLLDENIVLLKLAPPQGSEDIGRFMRGLIWTRLAHAVRERRNGAIPVMVAIDEFPTFLSAGGERTADGVADLLRLSRSKGVFWSFLAQDVVSIGRIAPTLPDIMRSNCPMQAFFRTRDDWSFALPVTGRRLRPKPAPWETHRRGYLEHGAELQLLRDELTRLPDRELYLWDQRTGLPAIRVRTADLKLSVRDDEIQALEARRSMSENVLPVAELERGVRDVEARIAALLAPVAPQPGRTPKRRGTRPVEMG